MAYQCDICGKTKQFGHNVSPSERKTNRAWKPNLHVKRFQIGSNKVKMKVCAQCLRTLKKQEVDSENSKQKPEKSTTTTKS